MKPKYINNQINLNTTTPLEVITIEGWKDKIIPSTAEINYYVNKDGFIYYIAKKAEPTEYSEVVEFFVSGKVENIETKIKKSIVFKTRYGQLVAGNKNMFDPYEKGLNALYEYAKENESKLFDKYGDFKENKKIFNNEKTLEVFAKAINKTPEDVENFWNIMAGHEVLNERKINK